GELLRAEGPGRPGAARRTFYLVRATGRAARFVSVLEPVIAVPSVRGVRAKGSVIEVETDQGVHRHAATAVGWEIETGGGRLRLAGARAPEPPLEPFIELDKPTPAVRAAAPSQQRARRHPFRWHTGIPGQPGGRGRRRQPHCAGEPGRRLGPKPRGGCVTRPAGGGAGQVATYAPRLSRDRRDRVARV